MTPVIARITKLIPTTQWTYRCSGVKRSIRRPVGLSCTFTGPFQA